MIAMTCDINLGGSTLQFLTYNKRNNDKQDFIDNLNKALFFRAKTVPFKQAQRLGCLIGVTYDQLGGDPYVLDCIMLAFKKGA